MADPHYRTRQFFRGFRPGLDPSEVARVRGLLGPAELALFQGMQARDRRHSAPAVGLALSAWSS